MSARRRRGEDEFADERPWLAEDDDAAPWPPDTEDDWLDRPDPAAGGGRRGRHSAPPGAPAEPGGWEPTAQLPRQAGPHGRPGPGTSPGWDEPARGDPRWGDPGRDDDCALRREPEPPPSRRAAPWDQDPRAGGGYPGGTGRNGLPGERYAGPAGRPPAGQNPGSGPAGGRSRRAGRRAAPPAGSPPPPAGYQDTGRQPAGYQDPGYQDPGDRYASPASPGADPLRRPSGRGADPVGGYGGPGRGDRPGSSGPTRYRDPGDRYGGQDDPYGAPGGRYGGRDDQYQDAGGQYQAPGGWDREAGGPYGDADERPGTPPGRRPGARGRYPGAGDGDGYSPPGRGTARQAGPDGDEYRDEYGQRAGRNDPGWDDEDDQQQEAGWPFGGGTGGSGGGSGGRKRRKRRGRWAGPSSLLIVAAIILIPLIAGGIYAYKVISAHYDPPNYSGAGTGTVIFQVEPGDNSETVGIRLVTDGVVASSRALVLAAEHSSNANQLEPGYYRLHKHMNAQLAWNLLLSPSARVQLKVTIPEGWRVSQILPVLAKQSGISAGDYTKAIKDTSALGLPSYAKGNPEGYLFPATYEIPPHSTATSVLKQMVTAFNQEAASVNLPKAAAKGNLTPAEAIVVASLAQAEGGKVSDFPKITRVIYNRLQAHMPLELDSTVLYALHTYGILASNQQLKVKSPYNTYAHQGLPPAPIDSPGNAAIQAALHPANGNWLYFVTVNPKTKQTDFTSSPTVFQQLKNELQRNLAHGG